MQCGARDFLATPVDPQELIKALGQIGKERNRDAAPSGVTAVINAQGGAGASVIASNIAHMMVAEFKTRTALVDLDLQFGVLPLYLDLRTNAGLLHAVEAIETLDEVAVEGWMLKHGSGLHVLANSHDQLILPGEIPESVIRVLLDLLRRAYAQVVVDLPRQIDPTFDAVAEKADRVIIVLQQNLASLRHAKTILMVLTGRLGLSASRILCVVNRWQKNADLARQDIERALNGASVVTLSNDWHRVTRSVDVGTPLLEEQARAPITQELLALTARVIGSEPEKKAGLFARLIKR
jgi:pilus assembly protein CpaE